MSKDNLKKAMSGKAVKELLKTVLEDLAEHPEINIKYNFNYQDGYSEYSPNQFKMDAAIEFQDSNNEIWLIKTTNSIRTDRVKGNQFDADHIKRINKNVTKIYLVTSDFADPKEVNNRKSYSAKIKDRKLYSVIDDVISFNTLSMLIRDKAVENLTQGRKANVLGSESEQRIYKAFNNEANIEIWNGIDAKDITTKSADYELFQEILFTHGLNRQKDIIKACYSTTKIPFLETGGQAKTDIHCGVSTNSCEYSINISAKQTAAKKVTVHEGYVKDLLPVLNLTDQSPMGIALFRLEECGGVKKLHESYPDSYNLLNQNLSKYNDQLIKYFVFGIGGPQNGIQVANMIVYTKLFKAMTVAELIKDIQNFKGQLGTPFSFTYPSGKRGTKIQVKAPTNN